MEKRAARVSEAQWEILLDFLERNPNMARARGYNNSARGRAESLRLWQEVATLLNSEGSGTTKSPKEWSVYVSNYKSKLKKVVAVINGDATATGGGPPQPSNLSNLDRRFLALLGPGFGQTAPRVMVQPLPDEQQPSTSASTATASEMLLVEIDDVTQSAEEIPITAEDPAQTPRLETNEPVVPRQSRRRRQRTRPLAPLEEAQRILSRVELQRIASDAANAQAHEQMARSLELASQNLQALGEVAHNLGRLADVAERYLEYLISSTP